MPRSRDLIKPRGPRTVGDDLEDVGHVIVESIISGFCVLCFFAFLGFALGVGELDQALYWLWSTIDEVLHR